MVRFKKIIKVILEILLPAIVIAFILDTFIMMPVRVVGTSMYPNLIEGDSGFSFIITKAFKKERFDIVVVDREEKLIVKRIIGLPNETIEYIDNKLYVDGNYIEEPFLKDVITKDFKVELKNDEYYCLGDNREVSKDSRIVGAFKGNDIKANHILILFPIKDFGFRK